MKDAIRNIRDLVINPYRFFMRTLGLAKFNLNQYILYLISVILVTSHKRGAVSVLQTICILGSIFLVGWIYMWIISICGGNLDYWRSLNGQVCMGTLVNLGELFEMCKWIRCGSTISFVISIYCIYLHMCYAINVGGATVKRTTIAYIVVFIMVTLIVYLSMGFLVLAGIMINERGYIS